MRRGTLLLVEAVFAWVALGALPAHASVKVLGSGLGRMCFEYAKAGHASARGVETCNLALAERTLTPEDRAATFVNRGILHMYAKELALASYEEAIKVNPGLADAYVNMGVALVNLGRDTEAVAAATKGLELNTERPEIAYYTRGVAHEMLGNMRAAYSDYRQAAALKPEWQEPKTQLQRFSVIPKTQG